MKNEGNRAFFWMQLRLECIGPDAGGLLRRIPGPEPDEIARVYVVRCEGRTDLFFRRDVPAAVQRRIQALGAERVFAAPEQALEPAAPGGSFDRWETYVFAQAPGPEAFPEAAALAPGETIPRPANEPGLPDGTRFVVPAAGQVQAECLPVRLNAEAAECWVHTEPAFRRRGYARQACAAWGRHVLRSGRAAFYSHHAGNAGSQALARSLGLRHVFSLVTVG